MNRPLLLLWALIAVCSVALTMLAWMWNSQHTVAAEQRGEEILATQLAEPARRIEEVFVGYDQAFEKDFASAKLESTAECMRLARLATVQMLVVVDASNNLVYPTPTSFRSESEAMLLAEALELLREFDDPRPKRPAATTIPGKDASSDDAAIAIGNLSDGNERQTQLAKSQATSAGAGDRNESLDGVRFRTYGNRAPRTAPTRQQVGSSDQAAEADSATDPKQTNNDSGDYRELTSDAQEGRANSQEEFSPTVGWVTWYHRRGMMLGYLAGDPGGYRCLAIMPSARWLADVIAGLPSSEDATPPTPFGGPNEKLNAGASPFEGCLIQLSDVEGKVVYQWSIDGSPETFEAELPHSVQQPLAAPLEGWRLRLQAPERVWATISAGQDSRVVWLGIVGLVAAMTAVGVLITLNFNRAVELAKRRVSFVNQVSHELRTPLTNIRMYADLLEREIDQEPQSTKLGVIRNEARRLGRLIDNVLLFAKAGKSRLELKPTLCDIDRIITEVVDTFRPRLDDAVMEINLDLQVGQMLPVDGVVLEQLMVNLIANAENYAAEGKRIDISSRLVDSSVQVAVRDYGMGVPAKLRERIFQPFYRSSDRIDAPSGTGIGLTIVRELAELHGGSCHLSDTSPGAEFVVQLALQTDAT